jgi:hypothetical protein
MIEQPPLNDTVLLFGPGMYDQGAWLLGYEAGVLYSQRDGALARIVYRMHAHHAPWWTYLNWADSPFNRGFVLGITGEEAVKEDGEGRHVSFYR